MFFSPFTIAFTSLSAFRMFVRFGFVWICRFPLPLGVWEGLQFVIVALPGLFSYLFFQFSVVRKKTDTVTIAIYAPVIESKPVDMASVYTTMRKSKETAVILGQCHATQTLDQQPYAISQQAKWSMPKEMKKNVLRLEGLHIVCTFIACIGKI